MISAIIGLILLVGGITLYKTFALYEEKKEFNVLRGRVPNFTSNYDIKLAFTINGEIQSGVLFPNKNDGYGVESVTCKNGVTAEWNATLWGLVNIQNETSTNVECMISFINTVLLNDYVEIGDYISYTPEITNYDIPTSLSGFSATQTINPSGLNLWRVIKKNSNGTIDVVSEYVDSPVTITGKVGYQNWVGMLNAAAKQYETEGITTGSRHMGYSGQSATVTTTQTFTTATDSTNSPNGSTREKNGGGDVGYVADYNLVANAIGTTVVNRVGTDEAISYALASRYYWQLGSGENRYFDVRYVGTDGSLKSINVFAYENGAWKDGGQTAQYLRPIITLKSGLTVVGKTYKDKNLWIVN